MGSLCVPICLYEDLTLLHWEVFLFRRRKWNCRNLLIYLLIWFMKDYIAGKLFQQNHFILLRERERESMPSQISFFIGASVVLERCVDVLGKASKSVLVSELNKTLCRWIVSRILRLSAKIVDVSLFIYSCMQCSEFSLTNPQPWRTISNKTNWQELKEKKLKRLPPCCQAFALDVKLW